MDETFKEKMGPFPVYVWGGLLAVGMLGYMYVSRKNAAAADANANTSAVTSDSSGYPVTTTDPLGSSGGGTTAGTVADSAAAPEATNQSWESQGVTLLRSTGVGGIAAQAALEQYLFGVPLTWAQGQYVDRVIAAYGLPPEGTQGVPSADPPATLPAPDGGGTATAVKAKPKPAHHPAAGWPKHYVTHKGDTLHSIADKFYGHHTPHYVNKIRTANGILATHKTFGEGRHLTIPRA